MKLMVHHVNMRGGYATREAWETEVTDEESGQKIGIVYAERSPVDPAFRRISLFGGKYQGQFTTPQECDAFAKGVEAVLNHLTSVSDRQAQSEAA